MALRFILGSSGAGKSRLLFETALRQAGEHPDRRYIILVPEQFTMQTQKELVKLSPVHGILNIDVLSFTRLAYRVFEETGVKKRTVLTETGKSLLLRLIAAREASGLSLLSGVLDRPGCLDELKSILSELDQYGIGEKELEQILEKIEKPEGHGGSGSRPALAGKLREILALQKAFLRYQEDRFITAQMLSEYPFLISDAAEENAELRTYIERVHGTNELLSMKILDDSMTVSLVEKGLGISVVAGAFLQDITKKVVIRPLEEEFYRTIGIVRSSQSLGNESVEQFIRYTQECFPKERLNEPFFKA